MPVLKRIDPMSLAKVYAVMMAIFGFVFGVLFTIPATFIGSVYSSQAGPLWMLGPFMIIVFPVMYGIMGFILGIISAWIYNFVASKIGGVKLEFGNRK